MCSRRLEKTNDFCRAETEAQSQRYHVVQGRGGVPIYQQVVSAVRRSAKDETNSHGQHYLQGGLVRLHGHAQPSMREVDRNSFR